MTWKLNHKHETSNDGLRAFSEIATLCARAAKSNTDSEYIIEERTPLSDQETESSCTGNGVADSLEQIMPDPVQQISRNFPYYNARLMDGDQCKDEGTYIRNVFSSIVVHGVCLEKTWPYEPSKVNVRPSLAAYEEAYDHRVGFSPVLGSQLAFYRITSRGKTLFEELESAIRAKRPVVFGTDVGQPFCDYFDKPNADCRFHYPTHVLGGHCMIFTGVRHIGGQIDFLARTSWGNRGGLVGLLGHAWMASDYVALSNDLTVPILAPTFFDK